MLDLAEKSVWLVRENFQSRYNYKDKSAARFYRQVAAGIPEIFATFVKWKVTKLLKTQQQMKVV